VLKPGGRFAVSDVVCAASCRPRCGRSMSCGSVRGRSADGGRVHCAPRVDWVRSHRHRADPVYEVGAGSWALRAGAEATRIGVFRFSILLPGIRRSQMPRRC